MLPRPVPACRLGQTGSSFFGKRPPLQAIASPSRDPPRVARPISVLAHLVLSWPFDFSWARERSLSLGTVVTPFPLISQCKLPHSLDLGHEDPGNNDFGELTPRKGT